MSDDPNLADSPRDPAARKTFKARQGRMSDLTVGAIDEFWPRFGIGEAPRPGHNPKPGVAPTIDPSGLFGGRPVVLEIGCGMGEAAVGMAAADRDSGLIAADVHIRGLARLLRAVDVAGLTNVRTVWADGLALLTQVPDASLAGIRVYFPDPWPKARHHKRRLVQPFFVALAASKLSTDGTLHVATDWADYAEQILAALSHEPRLQNASDAADGFLPRPDWRPLTRYERAGLNKGHTVRDVLFTRVEE